MRRALRKYIGFGLSSPARWGFTLCAGVRNHRSVTLCAAMQTPATLILVSHSPPCDRKGLLDSVYWHDMKVSS